jgi:hypothetical protein
LRIIGCHVGTYPLRGRRLWQKKFLICTLKRVAAQYDDAIRATLGSVAVEPYYNERGERTVWLEDAMADRLLAMRGPSESYGDVILRIAGRDDRKEPRA